MRREGVPDSKVRLVGNVMIDTLRRELPRARARGTAARLGLGERAYGVLTMHRPSNVDDRATLRELIELFHELAAALPLVFPVHPRTREAARQAGCGELLDGGSGHLLCLPPLPYLDTLALVAGARVVLTDSGGLQEETSVLRIPCLTLRENTERPVTVELGTSRLVGKSADRIRAAFKDVLRGDWPEGNDIPYWDGRAGPRVATAVAEWLGVGGRAPGCSR